MSEEGMVGSVGDGHEHAAGIEYALGAPLTGQQLLDLAEIARINLEQHPSFGTDFDEAIAWLRAHTGDQLAADMEYDPKLGHGVLLALRNDVGPAVGVGGYALAAASEKEFQRALAVRFLSLPEASVASPKIHGTVVGAVEHERAVESVATKHPGIALEYAGRVLGDDGLRAPEQLVRDVYDKYVKKYDSVPYVCLSKELIALIGVDRIRTVVAPKVNDRDYFTGQLVGGIKNLVALGILNSTEGLATARQYFDEGYSVGFQSLVDMAEDCPDTEALIADIKQGILRVVGDTSTPVALVENRIRDMTGSLLSSERGYVTELVEAGYAAHGDRAVFCLNRLAEDVLGQERVRAICQQAVDDLGEIESPHDKFKRVELLLGHDDLLDDQQLIALAWAVSTYAAAEPDAFLSRLDAFRISRRERKGGEYDVLIHKIIVDTLYSHVRADSIFKNIGYVLFELEGDSRVRADVLARVGEVTEVDLLRDPRVVALVPGGTAELAGIVVTNSHTKTESELEALFDRMASIVGVDETKSLFTGLINDRPDLAAALLSRSIVMFTDDEVKHMVDKLVASGNLEMILKFGSLRAVSYRIGVSGSKELLDTVVDRHRYYATGAMDRLMGVLGPDVIKEYAQRLMHANPGLVLLTFDNLPDSMLTRQEVIDFMNQDPRSQLAPKYMQGAIGQLSKSGNSPALAIVAQEVMTMYDRINTVLAVEGATDMYRRILRTSANQSERSERDALGYASILARQLDDLSVVQELADAKVHIIGALNEYLGTSLAVSPESARDIESKIGSLLPSAIYGEMLSGTKFEASSAHLGEALTAVVEGRFKAWRYGDREGLIARRILPNISQQQYEIWQENDSATSDDMHIGGAKDTASHIRRMFRDAGVPDHLASLAALPDPMISIAEWADRVRIIGQEIAALHKRKNESGAGSDPADREQLIALRLEQENLSHTINIVRLMNISETEVAAGRLFGAEGKLSKSSIESVMQDIIVRRERAGAGPDELQQLRDYLQQIYEPYRSYKENTGVDIGTVTVEDTDDYGVTVQIGAYPVGSCQHYEHGSFREGLAGFLDPGVKIMTARNSGGRLIARSILRLASDGEGKPIMVMEPIYMSQASDDVGTVLRARAKNKALAMGLPFLTLTRAADQKPYGEVYLHDTRAPYRYSDLFGRIYERGGDARSNLYALYAA